MTHQVPATALTDQALGNLVQAAKLALTTCSAGFYQLRDTEVSITTDEGFTVTFTVAIEAPAAEAAPEPLISGNQETENN